MPRKTKAEVQESIDKIEARITEEEGFVAPNAEKIRFFKEHIDDLKKLLKDAP